MWSGKIEQESRTQKQDENAKMNRESRGRRWNEKVECRKKREKMEYEIG